MVVMEDCCCGGALLVAMVVMDASVFLKAEKREVVVLTPWFFDMLAICNWFFRISVFSKVCAEGRGGD